MDSYYHDKPQERIPLSQQKEFRQIKNAVIQEAERLRLGEISFEEKGLDQQDEPEEYRNASYDYWTLRDIIRDESLTMEERSDAVSEMDKLAEKRRYVCAVPDGKALAGRTFADPGLGGSTVLVRAGGGAGTSGGTIFPC